MRSRYAETDDGLPGTQLFFHQKAVMKTRFQQCPPLSYFSWVSFTYKLYAPQAAVFSSCLMLNKKTVCSVLYENILQATEFISLRYGLWDRGPISFTAAILPYLYFVSPAQ